jgi:hyperosmotically inducible periplasmic protein
MRCFRPLSLAAALLLLSATLPAAAETAGGYIDDTAISTKIKASLIKDQELKAFDIHVETDHGVVHLTGTVDTSIQKADAVRIAKTTENVKDVVNDIVVTKK